MYDISNIIEVLRNIIEGVDPTTGEVFDPRELYNRPELHRITRELDGIAAGRKKPESRNRLNRPSEQIFNTLREWRKEQAIVQSLPPYCVFTDKELWSIAEGDVCKKEDLLLINGISDNRYNTYGDELFDIISEFM